MVAAAAVTAVVAGGYARAVRCRFGVVYCDVDSAQPPIRNMFLEANGFTREEGQKGVREVQ